jgi:hypothetical protein
MQHALTQSILLAAGKNTQQPFGELASKKLYPRSAINYNEEVHMATGSQTSVAVYLLHNNNNNNKHNDTLNYKLLFNVKH